MGSASIIILQRHSHSQDYLLIEVGEKKIKMPPMVRTQRQVRLSNNAVLKDKVQVALKALEKLPKDLRTAVMATAATVAAPVSKSAAMFAAKSIRQETPSLLQAAKSYHSINGSKRVRLTAPPQNLGYGGKSSMSIRGRTKYRVRDSAYLAGKYRKLKRKPLKLRAKRKMKKFDTLGVRENHEEGLDITDPKIVYIGHALNFRRLQRIFMQSLYRSMMKTI